MTRMSSARLSVLDRNRRLDRRHPTGDPHLVRPLVLDLVEESYLSTPSTKEQRMADLRTFCVTWIDGIADTYVEADDIEYPTSKDDTVVLLDGDRLALAANWAHVRQVRELTAEEAAEVVARKDAKKLIGDVYGAMAKRVDAPAVAVHDGQVTAA